MPNVSAAQMTITKNVENETSATRNTSNTAIIGDTLLYTITLTNSSSSLSMDNPVILDLLPQGLVAASAADENSFIANVTITDSTKTDSTLAITNVWRTSSDGYTLLEIVTSGSIAPGETVTITLEAVVDSTVLNYFSSNASMTNNVWMTSSDQGTVYHDNAIGSVFMGNTGSWAGNYTDPTTENIMATLLANLGFTGYGYISDAASINYEATSTVNLLKEVQGDQDEADGNWYYGDEGGTVTANTDEKSSTDDGYANFRLTVTNMTDGQDLTNIVLMDIVPKEDGASFNTNIDKEWSLIFDSITSVTVDGTDLDESHYTLWYYTGDVTTSTEVEAMQTAFSSDAKTGWVTSDNYSGDMSAVTAFAVVFDSTVSLGTGHKLQLIYKATVPLMTETEASNKAHLATYNDFTLTGDLVVSGTSNVVSSVSMYSNYVYALLSTEPVGVGGMFWIDADGDGIQDSEDVDPNSYVYIKDDGTEGSTASTYNSRTNNYSDYSVVQTLLSTASIQLLTYNGSTNSVMTTGTLDTSSWRFLFTGLASANISSTYTDATAYNSSGILWSTLAGASTASWYQLRATIAGNGSIKYSLTNTTSNVTSYDPDVMYSANNSSVGDALIDSNFSAGGSTETTSRTITGSAITTGSTTATSENFFLYGTTSGNALWNLSEDIGVVIYRDLTITKKDNDGSSPEAGSTFAVYGPYAENETITELTADKLVETYTLQNGETSHKFENLLYFQKYVIVETSADSSYELALATATGTNVSEIEAGITVVNEDSSTTTYQSAWILDIPTNDANQQNNNTDPTAYNNVTTDNMTVTNWKKGEVTVSKTVTGITTDKEFSFTLTLTDTDITDEIGLYTDESGTLKYTYTYTDGNGITLKDNQGNDRTGQFVVGSDGTYTFKLKDGESVTFSDIPEGLSYTVTEDAESGYTTTAKVTSGSGTVGQDEITVTGSIAEEGDVVAYTNDYSASAELTIQATKQLDNGLTASLPENTFSFTLTAATAATSTSGSAPVTTLTTDDDDSMTVYAATDGTVTFSSDTLLAWETSKDETYTLGVDYWYILQENELTGDYTTDSTIYCIKVNVKDVNYNGTLTVTETVYVGTLNTEDYTITFGAEASGDNLDNGGNPIFNDYSLINVYVSKDWEGDSNVSSVSRQNVTVLLQRRTAADTANNVKAGEWENIAVRVLTSADNWTYTWTGLSTTAAGMTTYYEYRVVEAALKEDAVTSSTDVDDYTAVESGTVSGANGTEYTVSISAPTSYSNAAGSTNSWTLTNTLKTTTLTVKKKVNGSTEDQKTSFTFTAEFKLGGSELAGTYSFQKYDASGNKLEESGDFGEIDLSSESELTFTLKHDQYIEISGLPVGTAYTVTEDSSYSGSYSTAWSDTDGQTESTLVAAGTLTQDEDENDASVTLTFTNTKKNGLNIEKVQSGGSISDTFIVTVLVWNTDTETIDDAVPYSGSYTLYASASDTTGTTETTENGTITFTDGQRIYIDLDYTQSYQVTEAQETGYEVPQYSTDNQTKWSTDAVTGTGKSPDYIYVKNQYKTGDLVITKNAEGGYSDAVFTFEVDLGISETDKKTEYTVSYTKVNESGDIVSAQADTTITSSNNTITLQDGWTATITGIDIGKTVTVTETGVSSASATNAGITASLSDYSTQVNDVDGDTYTANISNKTQTYTAVYTNVYETGDLTVSKTVTGIDESVGHDFEFTLTLTDPTGTIGLYTDENGTQKYTYTYTNENGEVLQDAEGKDRTGTFVVTSSEANSGTCTFNLKDGEYITFSNIPVNLTYTVTETEESGYTTTAAVTKNNSASSGTISNSDGQTATGSILQEGDRVAYKNAYSASADLTIEATKLLDDGRTTVPTNTFSFTLAAATDSTAVGATDTTLTRNTADSDVLTASAGIDGTVSFSSDDILKWTTSSDNGYYEDAVDYWFILEENDLTEPNASLYETDDTIYCIKVTVQDVEHNGTLTLTLDMYTGTEENGVITVNSEPENSDLIEAAIIETGSQSQKAQAARALLVFNNYSTISVSVEKLWDGDEDVQDLTRPASVLAVLQRQSTVTSADGSSTSTGEWENQDVQELNKAGSWSYTWNGLRTTEKDAEGNTIDYTYRVVEAALSSSYDTEQTGTPDAAEYEELTTFSGEGGSTYVVEVSEKETEAGSNEQSYEITNTLLTADLKVSKTVVGDSDDQADNSFTFTLSLTDDSESANALTGAYDYEVYAAGSGDEADSLISSGTVTTDSDGNVVFAETVAGETTESASITLAHGQYLLIKDLPTGMRYTVTEAENASFSPSYRIDGAEAEVGNTAEGTISEAESINADAEEAAEETAGTEETNGIGTDVAFTNTKLNGLNIRKIQSGGSTDDSFSIRITVKEADAEEYTAYTGTYRIADSDGVYGEEQTLTADADGCISIKNGETIHIELPYDTGYIVTEQLTEAQEEAYEAPLYAMITADSDEADETDEESADYTETPAEGNSSTASAVYVKNQHETGSLTLTKQLEGSYEDAEFTFSVDLGIADDDLTQSYIVTYAETNASGETVKAKADTTISSANDGSADGNIVLSAGQTATITNIDTGKTITVKEVSAKVKIDGVTYKISLDEYSTYFNSSEEASTVYTDTLTTTEPDIAVTCRNVYKTGSITLQKVNGSDNGHLNEVITTGTAEFILFRKIGDTWHYMTGYDSSKSVDAATWSDTGYSSVSEIGTTAYEAIKAAIANGKSDAYVISTEKGVCTLENMEIGEYQILELTAPDGYVRKETATSLTLEETTETVISASVAIANKETETETTKETTKETTTTKGTETESETDTSSPQTGDNTPLEVYTVVMLAAAAVLLLLEERRRRKNA
ncbi:MAG: DUF5979 domain-containing protein [Lachnospiraceae bacterium]|nr:DUF5979 domain-containing protein [Lachnospiraceae bacterium]